MGSPLLGGPSEKGRRGKYLRAKLRPRAVSLKEELELTTTANKQQTLIHTHMAIVGLCQIWHNDFSVTFRSHGARVKKRSLIGHTAAEI